MLAIRNARGFTLLDTLLAAGLVAGALVTLASLATTAARQTIASRRSTMAIVLAQGRLEELRAEAWRWDAAGARESSGALVQSPPDTLTSDVDGWFDLLDRFGAPVAGGERPHFRRRWAVTTFDGDPDTLVLQACVAGVDVPDNAPADACVFGIRTRKP